MVGTLACNCCLLTPGPGMTVNGFPASVRSAAKAHFRQLVVAPYGFTCFTASTSSFAAGSVAAPATPRLAPYPTAAPPWGRSGEVSPAPAVPPCGELFGVGGVPLCGEGFGVGGVVTCGELFGGGGVPLCGEGFGVDVVVTCGEGVDVGDVPPCGEFTILPTVLSITTSNPKFLAASPTPISCSLDRTHRSDKLLEHICRQAPTSHRI